MNKLNQVKNSTMNKFIIGLSCLGVLSAVSCDNKSNEPTIAPPLEKVSFSANNIANLVENTSKDGKGTITFKAGDKIKLYIIDGDHNAAKYYTEADSRQIAKEFDKDGTEFTFDESGIKNGFYLEAATGDGKEYTIKKFDIIEKEKGNEVSYVLKKDILFHVTTGNEKTIDVNVVEKKEVSISGEALPAKGKEVAFGAKDIKISPYGFKFKIKKSDGKFFNSTTDKDAVIHLTVKDRTTILCNIPNLFKNPFKDYAGLFTITLRREKEHYSNNGNNLTIGGTVTTKDGQKHNFTIESGTVKDGLVTLRVSTTPELRFKGADGKDAKNKEFDVIKNGVIKVFEVINNFGAEKFDVTYTWLLYKGDSDSAIKTISQDACKNGKINPYLITTTGGKMLNKLTYTQLRSYYLKVVFLIETDKGTTEGTLKLYFTDSSKT